MAEKSSTIEPTELKPLYLPSSLPQHLRQLPDILPLVDKEYCLCIAQADDSLAVTHGLCVSGLHEVSRQGY